MDAFHPCETIDEQSNVEFDRLCHTCASLFNEEACWEHFTYHDYRRHHDIFALASSAAHGCHMCNLILYQIKPEDAVQLQRNLSELVTHPARQIGIRISGETEVIPTIAARKGNLVDAHSPSADKQRESWSDVGRLIVRFEGDDYTNIKRSKAIWTCANTTITQIHEWLGICLFEHQKCHAIQTLSAQRAILPKRLLEIHRTIDTIYVTLSHCWGGKCGMSLISDNMRHPEAGIDIMRLPKTFRHAIHITAKLGVKYLWIDALCIIHDASNEVEWRDQASMMGDIYANSYVTLAATTSSNSESGLLHRRNPLSVWPCQISATWKCFKAGTVFVGTVGLSRETDMKPLEDRAWAFQEWLLSKRLIHFSHDQGMDADDAYFYGTTTKGIIVSLSDEELFGLDLWQRIRQEYSEKGLTKASDKLAAFSGIARMVHHILEASPEEYCAGLWKPRLLNGLLWEAYDDGARDRPQEMYVAPSWSWASLNGAYWILHDFNETDQWLAAVLDVHVQLAGDAFGPVEGGSLPLRCVLSNVTLEVVEQKSGCSRDFCWKLKQIDNTPVSYGSTTNLDSHVPGASDVTSKLNCHLVPMLLQTKKKYDSGSYLIGILLRPTELKQGQYSRIGLISVYIKNSDPEIMTVLAQGHCSRLENLYVDDQKNGERAIEIV